MKKVIEEPRHRNYSPGSMSFAAGFLGPRGNVGFFMVADYEKAKTIIEGLISSGREIDDVEMGLDGDWSENSMVIWDDGVFAEYDRHQESQWAEPLILVNFKDGSNEAYSAWKRGDNT